MTDPRYTKLAKLLVNYSTQIKKGDRALLDMIDVPDESCCSKQTTNRPRSSATSSCSG